MNYAAPLFLTIILLWIGFALSKHRKDLLLSRAIPEKLSIWMGDFFDLLNTIKDPRILFLVVALTFASWLVVALYALMVAPLFSLHLDGMSGVQLMCAMQLSGLLPSAPAGIGTQEAAGVALLQSLGIVKAQAFAFTLTLHAAMLAGQAFWGFPAIWLANLSIKFPQKRCLSEKDFIR
jgi:uncharacterized membrane protein YbhN (UPF0104 family)